MEEYFNPTENGAVTMVTPHGDHQTYRVFNGRFGILIGPENRSDWLNIGTVECGWIEIHPEFESRFGRHADYINDQFGYMDQGYLFRNSTICRKCGGLLTNPASIEAGIGPKCRGER